MDAQQRRLHRHSRTATLPSLNQRISLNFPEACPTRPSLDSEFLAQTIDVVAQLAFLPVVLFAVLKVPQNSLNLLSAGRGLDSFARGLAAKRGNLLVRPLGHIPFHELHNE